MNSTPILLAALLLVPMSRAEETSGTGGSGLEEAVAAASPPESRPAKSMAKAYAWAVGSTVVPIAIAYPMLNKENPTDREDLIGWPLMISGIFIGPSMGQFYAGSYLNGTGGIVVRAASVIGLVMAFSDCPLFDNGDESCGETGERVAAGIYTAGVLYSLVETYFAVNRANERARKAALSNTSLSPILYPTPDGRLIPGLAMSASF
jgi:hypothetical protein